MRRVMAGLYIVPFVETIPGMCSDGITEGFGPIASIAKLIEYSTNLKENEPDNRSAQRMIGETIEFIGIVKAIQDRKWSF